MRFVNITISLIALGACSSSYNDKKSCQESIISQLINPETAEFYDFEQSNEDDFKVGLENMVWREHGIARSNRSDYGDQLKVPIENLTRQLSESSPRYYTIRAKSESRVGLKITSRYVCAVPNNTTCACLNSDET